jgi:thromboxane-A synthase/cytochrome P450 family 3 subfamily A
MEPVNGSGKVNDAWALAMNLLPPWTHPLCLSAARVFPSKGVTALQRTNGVVRREIERLLQVAKSPAGAAATAASHPTAISILSQASHYAKYEGGRKLSDIEIVTQAWIFQSAGFESTSAALAHAAWFVAQDEVIMEKLAIEGKAFQALCEGRAVNHADVAAHLTYASACVDEGMRLKPPGSALPRMCEKACAVEGFVIPKGVRVLLALPVVHQDPVHFPEPQAFKPERWLDESFRAGLHPAAFLPFGAGPRMCIGYKFALQEAALALSAVFASFRVTLEPGQVPLKNSEGFTNKPMFGVKVRVERR